MAKRGRPPKPTKLKLLQGNPGKRPINKKEPKPKTTVPSCPAHLDVEAKKEWRRITRELSAIGLVSKIDMAALAVYAVAWSRWVEAEQKLKRFGVIIKSPSGYPIQSPYLAVANQAVKQMTSMLTEFGMTPASRTRVSVERPESQANDEEAIADRLLGPA